MSYLNQRNVRRTVTAVIAAAAGLLFVSSQHTAAGTNIRTAGLEDLRGLIINRAKGMVGLEQDVNALQKEVTQLTSTKVDPQLNSQI